MQQNPHWRSYNKIKTFFKQIPYEAILEVSEENRILTVKIDKSKVQAFPFLKPFIRKEYHFFSGFIKEDSEQIKAIISGFMKI